MEEQNSINKAYDSSKPNEDKQEQAKKILKKELNFKNKKQRLLEEQMLKEAKAKDNAKYNNSKKYRLSSAPKYQRNSVIKQQINQEKQNLNEADKEQAAQATDSTIADFNKRKSDGLIENDYEEEENRALNTSFNNENKNNEQHIDNNNEIKKSNKSKSKTIIDSNINNKSNVNKVNSSNNINIPPLKLNPLALGKYIDNKILISNKYTKLGLSARSLYSNKNISSKKLTKDINKSSSIPPLKIDFNNHINNINNNISSIKAKTKPNSPIKNKPNNIISIKSNHNNNFSSHRESLNLNQKSNNFNNNRNVKYYSNTNKSILDYSILDSRELNTSYYNDSNEIINYEEINNVLNKNENEDKVNDIEDNTNKDAKINNEDINNRKSSTQAFLHGMNFNKNMVNNNNDSFNPPKSKQSNKSLRSKSLMSRKSFKSFNNKNYNENYILTTNQAKQKRENKKEEENVIKNSEVNNDNDANDIINNEMKILSNKQASFYEKERTRSIIKQKALDKVKETQQIKEDINNTNFRMNSHSKFIIESKYKGITKPFYMLLSNKSRTLKSLKEAFIKQDEEKQKRNNSNININNNNFNNIGTYDSTIEKNNNTNNNNTEFFTKREKNNNDTNKNLMNNLDIQNNQNNEDGEHTEEDFWESHSNNEKPKFSEAKFFEWRMQNENWLVQRNIKRNLKKEALLIKEESNLVGLFKPNINIKRSNNKNSYNEKSINDISNNISNNSHYSNNGFGNRLYSYASYYNSNKKQLEKKYYSNMFKPSLNSKSLNIYFPEDDSTRDICDNSNYNDDIDSSYCSNSELNKKNGKNKQIKSNNTYKQYSRLSKPTTYQIEDNYESNVHNSVNSINKSPLKKSKTGNSQLIKNQIPERLSKYDNSQDNKDNKLYSYNNYNHVNYTNRTNTEQTNINNLNNYNNTLLSNTNSKISNNVFIKNAPQYTTPFKIVNNNSTGNVNIFVLGSKKLK